MTHASRYPMNYISNKINNIVYFGRPYVYVIIQYFTEFNVNLVTIAIFHNRQQIKENSVIL